MSPSLARRLLFAVFEQVAFDQRHRTIKSNWEILLEVANPRIIPVVAHTYHGGRSVQATVVGRQEAGRGAAPAARERLDALSRRARRGGPSHRRWRDDFLSGGKEALKGRRGPLIEDDRALRDAERKIGELTMEVEVWRRAAVKTGAAMPPAKRPR